MIPCKYLFHRGIRTLRAPNRLSKNALVFQVSLSPLVEDWPVSMLEVTLTSLTLRILELQKWLKCLFHFANKLCQSLLRLHLY